MASVEDDAHYGVEHARDLIGFDIAILDVDVESKFQIVNMKMKEDVKQNEFQKDDKGNEFQSVNMKMKCNRFAPLSDTDYDDHDHIDINAVDTGSTESTKKGRITIESGAAESVIPPSMLKECWSRSQQGRGQACVLSPSMVVRCPTLATNT